MPFFNGVAAVFGIEELRAPAACQLAFREQDDRAADDGEKGDARRHKVAVEG